MRGTAWLSGAVLLSAPKGSNKALSVDIGNVAVTEISLEIGQDDEVSSLRQARRSPEVRRVSAPAAVDWASLKGAGVCICLLESGGKGGVGGGVDVSR